jgi:hypothetical protein
MRRIGEEDKEKMIKKKRSRRRGRNLKERN